jgi:hypothetical protein
MWHQTQEIVKAYLGELHTQWLWTIPVALLVLLFATLRSRWFTKSNAPAWFSPIVLTLICGGAVHFSWKLRWLCDDAFISFRYAENLAQGNGLVFNLGEKVEGYTNFLWTLFIAAAIKLGGDPGQVAIVGSLVALVLTLYVTTQLVKRQEGWVTRPLVSLAAVALAANSCFAGFGTSGLETMAGTFFVILACERAEARSPLLAGLAGILATMSHPDHAIFYVALGGALLLDRERRQGLIRYVLPFLLIYVPYYAWRWNYYGDFFPNTYYAKSANLTYFSHGFTWLLVSGLSSGIGMLVPLVLVAFWRRRCSFLVRYVLLATPLYFFYTAKIGGDFMLGRLLCPILPLFFIVAELGVRDLFHLRQTKTACAAMFLGGLVLIPTTLIQPRQERWLIADERTFYRLTSFSPIKVSSDLFDYGQVLFKHFKARGLEPKVTTFRVGMIGYYSRLYLIDRFGLTDRTIAHQPIKQRGRPGHEKTGSLEYVLSKGADLTGWIPFYPPPYQALTRLNLDGMVLHMAHYRPQWVAELQGKPGVSFTDFPAYLDRYIAGEHPWDPASIARDVAFFETYYFSCNDDHKRREALTFLISP